MDEGIADSSPNTAQPLAAAVAARAFSPALQEPKLTPESQGSGGTDWTEDTHVSERSRSERGGSAARKLEFGGPPKRRPQSIPKSSASAGSAGAKAQSPANAGSGDIEEAMHMCTPLTLFKGVAFFVPWAPKRNRGCIVRAPGPQNVVGVAWLRKTNRAGLSH